MGKDQVMNNIDSQNIHKRLIHFIKKLSAFYTL